MTQRQLDIFNDDTQLVGTMDPASSSTPLSFENLIEISPKSEDESIPAIKTKKRKRKTINDDDSDDAEMRMNKARRIAQIVR